MGFFDWIAAAGFIVALVLLYLAVPLMIAYYLVKRKFMSDRLRYVFAGVLVFDALFILLLVILDLIA
jgi:hypothetical protein